MPPKLIVTFTAPFLVKPLQCDYIDSLIISDLRAKIGDIHFTGYEVPSLTWQFECDKKPLPSSTLISTLQRPGMALSIAAVAGPGSCYTLK
jgi:hypothetical protein